MMDSRRSHDDRLLDALGELEGRPFFGKMWRVARQERSVLDGSRGAGRWNPSHMSVLYGSEEPNGALAEIHYHLTQGQPIFPSRVKHYLHEIEIRTDRTLVFADIEELEALGVEKRRYTEMLYGRCQEIADAAAFLGFDGIIAPSARWNCNNIVLFLDTIDLENVKPVRKEPVDWPAWRARNLK